MAEPIVTLTTSQNGNYASQLTGSAMRVEQLGHDFVDAPERAVLLERVDPGGAQPWCLPSSSTRSVSSIAA